MTATRPPPVGDGVRHPTLAVAIGGVVWLLSAVLNARRPAVAA